MTDTSVARINWLNQVETCALRGSLGTCTQEQVQAGVVRFCLTGVLDAELVHSFLGLIDALYVQLNERSQQVYLLFDTLQLEGLTLLAQRALLLYSAKNEEPAGLLGVHCVVGQPLYRSIIQFLRRLSPRTRKVLFSHATLAEALIQIQIALQLESGDLKGAELKSESLETDHGALRYFQPTPQILLCQVEGVTNARLAHHMLEVHEHYLPLQRQSFGRAIIIMDSSLGRHCTIEAYRIMRGELGAASLQANDHLLIITPRWHRAVSKLVAGLFPNLKFRLSMVGSLEEALVAAKESQPTVSLDGERPKFKGRLPGLQTRKLIREQAAEIERLKQE